MADAKQTILIAEDDDNDFWFFELAFKKTAGSMSLVRVNDGVEAIDYLSRERDDADRRKRPNPDLIVLDLNMPRMDGFDVLEWLQKHPQLRSMPAIVLSSSEEEADIERAFQLGANSYLVKPREYDRYTSLVQMIKRILA
jgi:CheY-like chemotaxis protein